MTKDGKNNLNWIKIENMKCDRNTLKKFGVTMAVALSLLSLLLFRKHNSLAFPLAVIAAAFLLSALTFPLILKLVYILWMRLAFILGWVNTRLLLTIVFYLILTPVSLIIRLLRLDLISIKIDRTQDSYWIKKQRKDFVQKDYENQF